MSWTFSVALMRKKGGPQAMKKALLSALKRQAGYVPADDREPEATVALYTARGQRWMALTSIDLLPGEDPEVECERLRALASEMKTACVAFFNYMSDVLAIGVTDGARVQFAYCGYRDALDEYGLPTENTDLDLFDALLPDDAARARFREIIASEPTFSEEICGQVGELMGFSDELVYIPEDAEPYARLDLVLPEGGASFLMPPAALPAFKPQCSPSGGAFNTVNVYTRGGAGRGVEVAIEALDFDADDWDIPVLALFPAGDNMPQRSLNAFRTVPERTVFSDTGRKGWRWVCPDCPIDRGLDPRQDEYFSKKSLRFDFDHSLILYLTFLPKPGVAPRPYGVDFDVEPANPPVTPPIGRVRFTFRPLQNPASSASAEYFIHSYTPNPHPSADMTWWAGEYGDALRQWSKQTYGYY